MTDERIVRLERSLAEAGEREAATAEVLEVIGRPQFELEPVFETVLQQAVRLCNADAGQVYVLDEVQQARLRRRFTDMLVRGYLPREYKEYAKLFRNLQKSQIKSIAPLCVAFLKIHISLPQPFCPHGGKIP